MVGCKWSVLKNGDGIINMKHNLWNLLFVFLIWKTFSYFKVICFSQKKEEEEEDGFQIIDHSNKGKEIDMYFFPLIYVLQINFKNWSNFFDIIL